MTMDCWTKRTCNRHTRPRTRSGVILPTATDTASCLGRVGIGLQIRQYAGRILKTKGPESTTGCLEGTMQGKIVC